jgi:hypothetical protein
MKKKIETPEERLKKDEFGLYVNASNYVDQRARIIASEINHSKRKLEQIPKWIRRMFDAV